MKINLFLLFLVFLVLKLCNIITWSWWLITLPLWGGWAILLMGIVLMAVLKTVTRNG